ncbi:hypothetical protein Tco_0699968 [Tanacetum coccineum]
MNELEMLKQETMIQKSKCSSSRENTNAEDGKISKDALEIDNNVFGASHDKDNIIEVQSSNNEMFENVFAHDHDKKHAAEKTKADYKTLKEENILLKIEIKTYKERVRDFEKKPVQFINYKSAYENLQKHITRDESLNVKNENDFVKKAFKQNEDKYLDDIIQLQAKNKDLENIVCKMGKSSQTLHMLTNEQSLYRENTRKLGLGYKDPCFLGQVVAYNPKLYDAHVLRQEFVKLDMHDTEEILNDAEESQVKMKEKKFPVNYAKINQLCDMFVPQMELSIEQRYFLESSTSNVSPESSPQKSNLPPKKMPNESQLLKLFINLDNEINELGKLINIHHYIDRDKSFFYDNKDDIRRIFTREIFESMESEVDETSKKHEVLQNKIDQLLEANVANDVRNLVMQSYVEIKNREEIE